MLLTTGGRFGELDIPLVVPPSLFSLFSLLGGSFVFLLDVVGPCFLFLVFLPFFVWFGCFGLFMIGRVFIVFLICTFFWIFCDDHVDSPLHANIFLGAKHIKLLNIPAAIASI
jgi:hypothetical protein